MLRRTYFQPRWMIGADIVFLLLASVIAIAIRFGGAEMAGYGYWRFQGWLVLYIGVLLGNYLAGSYSMQHVFSRFNLTLQFLFALVCALALIGLISYTWLMTALGRGLLGLALTVYGVIAIPFKLWWHERLRRDPHGGLRVAVLGCGAQTHTLVPVVENEYIMPRHRVVAYLCPSGAACPAPVNAPVHAVDPATVAATARQLDIDVLITDFDRATAAQPFLVALKPLRFEGLQILTALAAMERYAGRIPLEMAAQRLPLLDAGEKDLLSVGRIKRILDLFFCIVAGLLLLGPFLLLAALLKLSAPRLPVFYRQTRIGQFGRPFPILKFRSMTPDAEAATGPVWSPRAGDTRVTRLGRFMRRFRIDELPQFYNVIKGEMSLVGPRPERPELIARVTAATPLFNERLDVPPGLTGWAQIRYPYGETVRDAVRKLEYDLYYIKNMSPLLDLRILISTLRIVLFGVKP